MADSTPLERLDTAIERFMIETDQLQDGGFVTGWALGISKSRVQADDPDALPMVSGTTYSIGPQTSVMQFTGLAKYLEVVAEKVIWEQLSDDPDD